MEEDDGFSQLHWTAKVFNQTFFNQTSWNDSLYLEDELLEASEDAEEKSTKLYSVYRVIFNESDYVEAAKGLSSADQEDPQTFINEPSLDFTMATQTIIDATQSPWVTSSLPSMTNTILNEWFSSSLAVPSDEPSLDAAPFEIFNLLNGTSFFPEGNGSILDIVGNNSFPNVTNAAYEPSFQIQTVYSLYEVILIALVTMTLSMTTLIGNLMVMISFKIDKQLQTISNYFLFSLAIADITIGVISMPLFTLYTLLGYWPLGPYVCDTWLALDYLASNASVLNLLIISFDRYFSVTRPLTYRAKRTNRRAAVMIASAWTFSLILWPPWIYSWPYIEGKRTVPAGQCYIQFIETNEIITVVTAVAAFYLPVTVMCGLYWRIWRETEKRQKDLTNLQAGKKDPSKRSNSRPGVPILSDPTSFTDTAVSKSEAEECQEQEEWRRQRSESSTAMEEIETTYVPAAMVIDNSKFTAKKSKYGCCRGLASCIKKTVDEKNDSKGNKKTQGYLTPGYNTPGYHTPSYHTGGCHTPGSVETTIIPSVSRCPSVNYIKESTAVPNNRYPRESMIPLVERSAIDRMDHHSFIHYGHQTSSTLPRAETSLGIGTRAVRGGRLHARSYSSDSVYTILIRLPHEPTPDGPLHPPSILMIEEEGDANNKETEVTNRFSRGPSPLPPPNMEDASSAGGRTPRLVDYSLHVGGAELATAVLPRKQLHSQDIKLPLNAKIIPKQLAKSTNSGGSGSMSGANSGTTGTVARKKKKKKSTEKKQDRKAAKTLSAILLAFIITWTPYNVLVILKSVLVCKDCIPNTLWMFAYFFCYVNSTINPMCYALCNAAFRRTYVRILTCKWHSRRKQGVQRGYYS